MVDECLKSPGQDASVRGYLVDAVADFGKVNGRNAVVAGAQSCAASQIFATQTRREFCYLSAKRVEPYRQDALSWIGQDVAEDRPVHYYYDIGGGYHASLAPGHEPLVFSPGLGELLLLRQVKRFCDRVRSMYSPGARFSLVIDNLAALLINGIPLESTQQYVAGLRTLVDELGMAGSVDLLVESEHFSAADFDRQLAEDESRTSAASPTGKVHETVERFLGRKVSAEEAATRADRWARVCAVSEQLFGTIIHGVHMTQRASPTTLCFRPFPGGDSRIQSGQVALMHGEGETIRPVLLTSHNYRRYETQRMRFPDLLPTSVPEVICAVPTVTGH